MNKPTKQSRGAAIRARKRTIDDVNRKLRLPQATPKAAPQAASGALKLTFLGGLEQVGEKNMAVIEYGDEAIILDCGNNLGVELPGINYTINDFSYLESIRHKIKAYVITHGHLDHIGGLRHTVPRYPAPVYAPPVVVVPPEPTVYVEQGSAAANPAEPVAGYWYFCREANNYYPYVKECPGGWQQVAPQPAN